MSRLRIFSEIDPNAPSLELTDHARGHSFAGYERTVDVHVKNLRRKLEPSAASPRFIETVRGVGYRLGVSVVGTAVAKSPGWTLPQRDRRPACHSSLRSESVDGSPVVQETDSSLRSE